MSVYNPPSFEEYLSVFNPADWGAGASSGGIDTAFLDANYLKFPLAQGTENLLTTNISGKLTSNGEVEIKNTNNKITLGGTSGSTNQIIVGSGNPLLTCSTLGGSNTIIGSSTTGRLFAYSSGSYNNIAIGDGALSSTASTLSDAPAYNCAIGKDSLKDLNGNFISNTTNTGIGYGTLFNLINGSNNYAGGYAAGLGLTTGDNNTFIGAVSTLDAALGGVMSNSIVIGRNAAAKASNQIYLGGTTTSCVLGSGIPLTFEAANTTLSTGINNQTIALGSTPTFAWDFHYLTSLVRFTANGNFQINLDDTIDAKYSNKPFWISNASAYTATIASSTGTKTIRGRYGTETSTLKLEAGGTIGLYFDTDWYVFYKDSGCQIISATSTTLTNAGYLGNSIIRLTPSTTQSITIPTLSASTNGLLNSVVTFSNQSAFNSTLSSGSNFTGLFGTQTTSITLYPYSNIILQPNATTFTYDVIARNPSQITQAISYTGTTITLTYNQIDSIINLSGSTNTTLNLPSPLIASNPNITGRYYRVYNNGSALITVGAGGATFTGSYGNASANISLLDNTWYNFTSNGTTWDINERSSNITFSNTLIGNVNYASNANYTDATIRLSSNGAYTVTLPSPTTTTTHTTTSKYINNSVYNLTLSIGAGIFTGKYGTGTTSYLLLPNTSVELYSDGSNYFCQDRSSNYIYNYYVGSSTLNWSSSNQYLDCQVNIAAPDDTTAIAAAGSSNLSGTATQAGTVLTIATLTTGTISAGSVISITGFSKVIVYSQLTGTLGGVGTYEVNIVQTVASATAFTGFYATTTVMTGTLSQAIFSSFTGVNIPTATVNTITTGGNNFNSGTSIYASGMPNNYSYIMATANSGGVGSYQISTAPAAAITTQTYYATAAGTIQIPTPSTTYLNRRMTFTNNSYNCVSITTTGGTALFGGLYGQLLNASTGTTPATNDTQYLLRPAKTVVLECDGTNWNAIVGTSVSATKMFQSGNVNTGTADGAAANVSTISPVYCTDGGLYSLQNSASNGAIINTSPYPMTLLVTLRASWNTPTTTTGTSISTRTIGINTSTILTGGAGTNFQLPLTQTTTPNTQAITTASTGTLTYSGSLVQTHSQIVVLNFGDSFRVQIYKTSGAAATETLSGIYISCQRLF